MGNVVSVVRRFFQRQKTPVYSLKGRVAIIGGGIGGCSVAYFLRELCSDPGDELELHVFNDSEVAGGRCAVVEVAGNKYEAGASIIHTSNRYMTHFREEFGLEELNSSKLPTQSSAIYNGTLPFVLKLGFSSFINNMKLLWKYGFSLFKMSHTVKSTVKKFSNIYDLQAAGHSYKTVPAMLEAMGGESFINMTKTTAEDHFKHNLGWNAKLVDEVICTAMKVNYGQDNNIDAFTGMVSLAGMEDGYLWSVVGGNYQIADKVLEASNAEYHNSRVLSVTAKANGSYSVDYAEGSNVETSEFDVVIIAHPLNQSTINFTPSLDIPGTKDEYHRTVATFIKGKPNAELFGYPSKDDYPKDFPLSIMTNNFVVDPPPVNFNSISQVIPATATIKEAKKYCRPLCDLPTQVFKVFSNAPLSDEDKDKLFGTIEDEDEVVVKEWRAYPQYKPPQTFPPFILDDQGGLFYINGIEMAASAMEMSVIGAKNVSLLAKDFILKKRNQINFNEE